jgi:hypothetical protein
MANTRIWGVDLPTSMCWLAWNAHFLLRPEFDTGDKDDLGDTGEAR